jgi:glutathione synthase/RimK-type ligase-like ATP-grasp enzyme
MPKNTDTPSPHTLVVVEGREENRRMVDDFTKEATKRGWQSYQLLGINSDAIARFDFDGIPLEYVIFRDLSKNTYIETERFLLWLQHNRKLCINGNATGGRVCTSDKHFQQGLFMLDPFLAQYALPTFEAKTKSNILAYVEAGRVHFPFVLKPRLGTTGAGIVLVKSPKDLERISNLRTYIIEQYIEPECDYRVFVIGGTAVGIMRKTGDRSNPGDFKVWSSGRNRYPEKDPETVSVLSDIATRAAAISRLEYTGIDIIKEKGTGKYYLLETNFAAGWGNRFIETTHANIPAFTLDWFEDMEKGREQPVADAVTNYISRRKVFLPIKIQRDYDAILAGDGSRLDSYDSVFAKYPSRHITDAGNLFETLKTAYRDVVDHPDKVSDCSNLVHTVELLPLSWAGCFIGPDVGTLHDGAILSAMYLYLLHKTRKI